MTTTKDQPERYITGPSGVKISESEWIKSQTAQWQSESTARRNFDILYKSEHELTDQPNGEYIPEKCQDPLEAIGGCVMPEGTCSQCTKGV